MKLVEEGSDDRNVVKEDEEPTTYALALYLPYPPPSLLGMRKEEGDVRISSNWRKRTPAGEIGTGRSYATFGSPSLLLSASLPFSTLVAIGRTRGDDSNCASRGRDVLSVQMPAGIASSLT